MKRVTGLGHPGWSASPCAAVRCLWVRFSAQPVLPASFTAAINDKQSQRSDERFTLNQYQSELCDRVTAASALWLLSGLKVEKIKHLELAGDGPSAPCTGAASSPGDARRGLQGKRCSERSPPCSRAERLHLAQKLKKINLKDIGDIYKVRVGHDNSGNDPRWYLEEIRLENIDTLVLYVVHVCTGRRPGAETESRVFINLIGTRGDSGARRLHRSKNNKVTFRRGQVDIFSIEAVSLGKLKKVLISHDGTGPGNGWFLESVVVKSEEEDGGQEVLFPCNRWLDEYQDDSRTERELLADSRCGAAGGTASAAS
ncbi:hypothetical protein CB1_001437042 [Camelus ferus]|nr:hypothetical protein CB1_001437042 [Camelus ferus]